MKIYRILQIVAVFCCFAFNASAQNISVASFKMDEMDLTANQQGTIVLDQNGEKCALIKVRTTETQFLFDVGSLGIQKVEQKPAQIWVYVPHGIRKMIISHQKYGNIEFPMPVNIEKARTYVMELKTENPKQAVQQKLTIKCLQQGALVSIDGQMINLVNGAADITLPLGNHTFIAMASGYYQQSGTIELVASHPGKLTIDLDSDGSQQVSQSAVLGEHDNRQAVTPAAVARPDNVGTYSVVGNMHTVNGVSFKMVLVEGGTFSMGATPEMTNPDDYELPVHRVTLSSYSIGETEVTQELWQAVMGENPSRFKGDQNPVEQVSWDDCQEFISRLNEITGKKFRLPTEAEWEFAARGGNRSRHAQYSGSDNPDEVAWYDKNSSSKTHPVKQKQANELGLYDMSGNVWEWCNDWFGSYSSNAQTNPTGPTTGYPRVFRGGNWYNYAGDSRCSCRDYSNTSDLRAIHLGLRLALSEDQGEEARPVKAVRQSFLGLSVREK